MGKWVPKIILEGTRLTHKTELAFALNEHPRLVGPRKYRYHSPLISAEWCGFTNTAWGRGPINYLPEQREQAMETYRTWVKLIELQKYYSWIIDRFHISTQVAQWGMTGERIDFTWLEDRLAAMNFRLVFVKRGPASFAAAREERLKVSGNPSQYDDLSEFIREQAVFEQFIERTKLATLTLDMTDKDVHTGTEEIIDWVIQTGGRELVDE